jgi:hypothetical protein
MHDAARTGAQVEAGSVTTAGANSLPYVLAGAVAAIYLVTAATTILGGDSAEFALVGTHGGIPHPPGYPAYVLWLRLFSWLPGTTPAHVVSLATALLGILAVDRLRAASMAWGASPVAASVAAAMFAMAPLAWTLSTSPEVFALNALMAALVVWLSGPFAAVRGVWRGLALGVVGGLALANHHTIVLLAPVGLHGLWLACRESRRPILILAAAATGAVSGLLPYLYLLVVGRAGGVAGSWSWGELVSLGDLLHHVLRRDYGTTSLGIRDDGVSPWTNIAALLLNLLYQTRWLGSFAALLAALWLLSARRRELDLPGRWSTLALASSFVLAGPVFASLMNLSPEGLSFQVIERFHLLPLLLVSVFAALGLELVLRAFPLRPELHLGLLSAILCIGAALGLNSLKEHHRPDVDAYLENIARTVPPGAVIMGTGDHRLFGMAYLAGTRSGQPTPVYVDPTMLLYDWYRHRIERGLGFALPAPVNRSVAPVAVIQAIQQHGRPVFVANVFKPEVLQRFRSYPIGSLIRLLTEAETPPHPVEIMRANRDLQAQLTPFDPVPPAPGTWAAETREQYARTWDALAGMFRALNMRDLEAEARDESRELVPWRAAPQPQE